MEFGKVASFPRDPGSPKLRMVSWNLNTLRFGCDYTPLAHHLRFGDWIPRVCLDTPQKMLFLPNIQRFDFTNTTTEMASKPQHFLGNHVANSWPPHRYQTTLHKQGWIARQALRPCRPAKPRCDEKPFG